MSTTIAIWLLALIVIAIPFAIRSIMRMTREEQEQERQAALRVAQEVGGQMWHPSATMHEQPFKEMPELKWSGGSSSVLSPAIEVTAADHRIIVFHVQGKMGNAEIAHRVYVAVEVFKVILPVFHADPWRPVLRKLVPGLSGSEEKIQLSTGTKWRFIRESEGDGNVLPLSVVERLCIIADRSSNCRFVNGGGGWLLSGGAEGCDEDRYRELVGVGRELYNVLADQMQHLEHTQ